MDKKKVISIGIIALFLVIVLAGGSYAVISRTLAADKNYVVNVGDLDVVIDNESDSISLGSAYPTTDTDGKKLTPYTFTLTSNAKDNLSYAVKIIDMDGNNLGRDKIKFFVEQDGNISGPKLLSELDHIYRGVISKGQSHNFTLRIWLDIDATIAEVGKVFKGKIEVTATQIIETVYSDNSGASYPELKGDLIPVKISNTGSVTKANLAEEWYDYSKSEWANAVILNDNYGPYQDGASIPEEAIESYFVWIPRYRYRIFDEGNYTTLTAKENKEQEIEIAFESKTVRPSTGSTKGTWLTHPAFTSFDSDGFWVGKFESGYRGATSPEGAQQDVADKTKLIIKPNVYSWSNITVGNAFKTSYEYNRSLDSHMMKNTEWGAVAYLSHSKYGNVGNVRINNNTSYVTGYAATEEPTKGYSASSIVGNRQEAKIPGYDGTYTVNYYNIASVVASTTNNYSGVYDMSGGVWEYVIGTINNTAGSSDITSVVSDFYTNDIWVKYYDMYLNETNSTTFSNRILGDATGEMGPFFSQTDSDNSVRNKSSWYENYSYFTVSSFPWYRRGGYCFDGTASGLFSFAVDTGGAYPGMSFRVVLQDKFINIE